MTSVISVRGRVPAELMADPTFLYCGRAMPRQGWPASIWGNPFRGDMGMDGARRVFEAIKATDWTDAPLPRFDRPITILELHEAYVRCRLSLWERLPELVDRRLGCWCCKAEWTPAKGGPLACHAQTLCLLAEGLNPADYREPAGRLFP